MKYCNYLAENASELVMNEVKKNNKVTIYYNVDHVSASGNTRYITLRMLKDNNLIILTKQRKIVGGGMNMVFSLVYDYIIKPCENKSRCEIMAENIRLLEF